MRGKPRPHHRRPVHARIIPAHAGQTTEVPLSTASSTDHPRACGANDSDATHLTDSYGSSPRMRGKHPDHRGRHPWRRIIPAHAGQTACRLLISMCYTDHPRACGANMSWPALPRGVRGSSPRMRGKHEHGGHRRKHVRIIPAHAGQTKVSLPKLSWSPDHPRACGANSTCTRMPTSGTGSSPRMRGKPVEQRRRRAGDRIIPAHAGQTVAGKENAAEESDHPRACGANLESKKEVIETYGSSPRMRGKHRDDLRRHRLPRIIPAHAGQTSGGMAL